jgi:hypothetical protein
MVKGHNKLPVYDDAASADLLVCVCVNDKATRYKSVVCTKYAGTERQESFFLPGRGRCCGPPTLELKNRSSFSSSTVDRA